MRISDWSSDVCSSDLDPHVEDEKLNGDFLMENNANNSENASKREFRPIFNATITPQSIETLQTSKGDNYLKMTGATVAFKDKSQERTVMAFGKSVADVEALLETRSEEHTSELKSL